MMKTEPCPFCKSSDIRYSMKITGNGGTKRFHATFYCNKCHAYGPRVLTQVFKWNDYDGSSKQRKNEDIKLQALNKWNERI